MQSTLVIEEIDEKDDSLQVFGLGSTQACEDRRSLLAESERLLPVPDMPIDESKAFKSRCGVILGVRDIGSVRKKCCTLFLLAQFSSRHGILIERFTQSKYDVVPRRVHSNLANIARGSIWFLDSVLGSFVVKVKDFTTQRCHMKRALEDFCIRIFTFSRCRY